LARREVLGEGDTEGRGEPVSGLLALQAVLAAAVIVMGVMWVHNVFFTPETEEEEIKRKLKGLARLRAELDWDDYWPDEAEREEARMLIEVVEAGDEVGKALTRITEMVHGNPEEEAVGAAKVALRIYQEKRQAIEAMGAGT
jgi:hypothetical protein